MRDILDHDSDTMMKAHARQIGAWTGVICSFAGICIAQCMIMAINSTNARDWEHNFYWFLDISFLPNLCFGILATLLTAWHIGGNAGQGILVEAYNSSLTGIFTALATVVSGAFAGSCWGFIRALIGGKEEFLDVVQDYLVGPIFVIGMYGCVFWIVLGLVFGAIVKSWRTG